MEIIFLAIALFFGLCFVANAISSLASAIKGRDELRIVVRHTFNYAGLEIKRRKDGEWWIEGPH